MRNRRSPMVVVLAIAIAIAMACQPGVIDDQWSQGGTYQIGEASQLGDRPAIFGCANGTLFATGAAIAVLGIVAYDVFAIVEPTPAGEIAAVPINTMGIAFVGFGVSVAIAGYAECLAPLGNALWHLWVNGSENVRAIAANAIAYVRDGAATITERRTCNDATYNQLVDQKKHWCDRDIHCTSLMTCEQISELISNGSRCVDARKAITDICFGGVASQTHQQALNETLVALTNCQRLYTTRCTNTMVPGASPPPEPPPPEPPPPEPPPPPSCWWEPCGGDCSDRTVCDDGTYGGCVSRHDLCGDGGYCDGEWCVYY